MWRKISTKIKKYELFVSTKYLNAFRNVFKKLYIKFNLLPLVMINYFKLNN